MPLDTVLSHTLFLCGAHFPPIKKPDCSLYIQFCTREKQLRLSCLNHFQWHWSMIALENAAAKYIFVILLLVLIFEGPNMRQQRIRLHHTQVTKF